MWLLKWGMSLAPLVSETQAFIAWPSLMTLLGQLLKEGLYLSKRERSVPMYSKVPRSKVDDFSSIKAIIVQKSLPPPKQSLCSHSSLHSFSDPTKLAKLFPFQFFLSQHFPFQVFFCLFVLFNCPYPHSLSPLPTSYPLASRYRDSISSSVCWLESIWYAKKGYSALCYWMYILSWHIGSSGAWQGRY